MPTNHRGRRFPQWKSGEAITESRLNALTQELERLSAFAASTGITGDLSCSSFDAAQNKWRPKFHIVRLKDGEAMASTPSESQDRTAVIQWFNPTSSNFEDTSPEQTIEVVTAFGGFVYDEDDVFIVMSHWSGKYVPVAPIQPRPAITINDGGGYPVEGRRPNSTMPVVYAIQFLHLEFDGLDQFVPHITSEVPSEAQSQEVCYNLNHGKFIPEGARIWVFQVAGVWVTWAGELHTTRVGKVTTQISAGNSTSPGTGVVLPDRIRTDTGQYAHADAGGVTVYNTSGQTFAVDDRVLIHLDTLGRHGVNAEDIEYVWVVAPSGVDAREMATLCNTTPSLHYFGGVNDMLIEFLNGYSSDQGTIDFEGAAGAWLGVVLMQPGLYHFRYIISFAPPSTFTEDEFSGCAEFIAQRANMVLVIDGDSSSETDLECSLKPVAHLTFCTQSLAPQVVGSAFLKVDAAPVTVELKMRDVAVDPDIGIQVDDATLDVWYEGNKSWSEVM